MNPLIYWNTENFQLTSFEKLLNDRANTQTNISNTDISGKCTYTYNELGFRGDSIHKEGFKVMSLGCSITEGIGVNDNETWSAQFSSIIENGVNLNFGSGGRSNDFIVRCLLTYYDLIKPDLVLIMYTFPHRKEFYTKDNELNSFALTSKLKNISRNQQIIMEYQNDNEDFINWYKNHQLIKYFLATKNCNWVWNGCFSTSTQYQEINRFDGDFGINTFDVGSDGIHPGKIRHEVYANKLEGFISKSFPNYVKYKQITKLI